MIDAGLRCRSAIEDQSLYITGRRKLLCNTISHEVSDRIHQSRDTALAAVELQDRIDDSIPCGQPKFTHDDAAYLEYALHTATECLSVAIDASV